MTDEGTILSTADGRGYSFALDAEELIQKYHLIPLEEALDRLRKKLGK